MYFQNPNSRIMYSFDKSSFNGSGSDVFIINQDSGLITIGKPLSNYRTEKYKVR